MFCVKHLHNSIMLGEKISVAPLKLVNTKIVCLSKTKSLKKHLKIYESCIVPRFAVKQIVLRSCSISKKNVGKWETYKESRK